MTNEQAAELLALMADQLKATDHQTETFERRFTQLTDSFERRFTQLTDSFERRFTQLNETMLNGFVRLENKFDKLTGQVDHLTEEVREVKQDVRDIKAENQLTNRRLQATFEQAGHLTEANTAKETRLVKLETEVPSNAELHRRVLALEEQMRRAS